MAVSCTIGILTFNSASVLRSALDSVLDFDDVIVCDGGSSDDTRRIAAAYGCRIIEQDERFKDSNNRLVDIAGTRQQILSAAVNDWVMMLDSDEMLTSELAQEIRRVVSGEPEHAAYQVPRKYVVDGRVIECSMLYPRHQMRLVNRREIVGYVGIVHDVPELRPDASVGTLTHAQLVPQEPLLSLWRKWLSYLRLEEVKHNGLGFEEWRTAVAVPNLRSVRWLAKRFVRSRRSPCDGPRLPARYEVGYLAYYALVVWYTGRRFLGLGRADAERAWR